MTDAEGDPSALEAAWPEPPRAARPVPLTESQEELVRLAGAMRDVVHRLVRTDAPLEQITAAADALTDIAERFGGHGNASIYEGFGETANSGDPNGFFLHSPISGHANPLAAPLEIWIDGETVRGRGRYGAAYEGPPGCLHGGYIAAAFDEVLGSAQSLSGAPGMTGRLSVSYRNPTPLHTELRFEGELVGVEGRKISTAGRLYAGSTLCAEAEALFISIDFSKLAGLMVRRAERRARQED